MLDAGSQARLRVKCEKGTGGHDWLPFELLRRDCHYGHEMDIKVELRPFSNGKSEEDTKEARTLEKSE